MKILFRYVAPVVFLLAGMACSNAEDKQYDVLKPVAPGVSGNIKTGDKRLAFELTEGVLGVFDVPKMLCLGILDSAAMKDMAVKVRIHFAILDEEVKYTGADYEGVPGQVLYNNDLNNFRFQSVFLINGVPALEPKRSKVVVLPPAKMVVYNFYGPYEELSRAYAKTRQYCNENHLNVVGPVREFYITDPGAQPDPSKWLTRVMVPVARGK